MTRREGKYEAMASNQLGGLAGRPRLLQRALCALLLAAATSPLSAQITVGIVPDTVRVRPDRAGRAFLTLTNTDSSVVRDLRLEWLISDSLTVSLGDPLLGELGPSEAVSYALTVEGRPRAGGDRALLNISFRSADEARRSVVTSIPIAPAPLTTVSDVLTVEILTSLASLTDGASGTVHLRAENKSDFPVVLDTVRPDGPSFISFQPVPGVEIPARGSAVIRVDLRAETRVRSGKHTLLFEVPVRWTGPDGPMEGTLILSREVDVGVLGESQILEILALPSFLFLPGFLMVVAFGMLRRARVADGTLSDDPKKPEFWLVAIGLSLMWVIVVPALGGRDYLLDGYGIRDIAWVWFVSVLLGVVVALGVGVIKSYRARQAAADLAASVPDPDDEPTDALRKLARSGHTGVQVVQVVLTLADGAKVQAYLLADPAEDGRLWVAPPIQYEWADGVGTEPRKTLSLALTQGDLAKLADTFEALDDQKHFKDVSWAARGKLRAPAPVEGSDIQRRSPGVFVVEL